MWQDILKRSGGRTKGYVVRKCEIIKINLQPYTPHAQRRYTIRLVKRFVEQVSHNQPFSSKDVLDFYNSPEQSEYKNLNDWVPSTISINWAISKHGLKKRKVERGAFSSYGDIGQGKRIIFVRGQWPDEE